MDELILSHYEEQAEKYGNSPDSTMQDVVIRKKEIDLIKKYFSLFKDKSNLQILDLGCGNGNTLEIISKEFPHNSYWGLDYSRDMIDLAKERNINCKFVHGDSRKTSFESGKFDIIYTERCLINILNWEQQKRSIYEIYRMLNNKGRYLMIECFDDGHDNYNRARTECGLETIKEAYHNKYFVKELFLEAIETLFELEELPGLWSNFLSTHYFISRVIYPLMTKREFIRNTEFVKFFSSMPQHVGNYSPLQAFFLRKIGK